ncbi:MAG: J domain-containing protein, partial [Oligoflexia bacterium]|nr:J domain-containing protein [Oligoflexia bacterium]
MSIKNPFEILGIEPANYDDARLKQVYLDLVRRFTPERAPEMFREIRKAYDIIRNAKSPYEILSITPLNPLDENLSKETL